MKIARIIMNLNATQGQILNGNPWDNHKKYIFSEYKSDRNGYIKRIESVVDCCIKNGCEIVLFPACTFVYRNDNDLKVYENICRKVSYVLSGYLKTTDREDARVLMNGKVVDIFDSSTAFKTTIGDFCVFAAISSTVKAIKTGDIITSKHYKDKPKTLVLDLGHHQYKGRYILTLKSVFNYLKPMKCKGVFLSFWKFNGGKVQADWFVSSTKLNVKQIDIKTDRQIDFVDIVNV